MVYSYSGQSANEVWSLATEELFTQKFSVKSRLGNTKEILHVILSISDPRQRWVTQRMPPISIAFSLAELMWILAGNNESKIINFWNPILPKFCGQDDNYHGAYGFRIKCNFGFDQLERAYYALKNQPDNRQTVISIWDPKKDFPDIKGLPVNNDIPCNICSLIKIRDQKLEWTQIMRSNDVFRGLPYNFVQFTSLQEILAGWLDIEIGSYTQYSDSLHLYKNDENLWINHNDGNNLWNKDNLALNKAMFSEVIEDIFQRMTIIAKGKISVSELQKLSNLKYQNEAYCNIMFIIAAYAARKFGFIELERDLISKCSNELYIRMWENWIHFRNLKE
ncbi:MAG: thymidylate synthase [Syntrophomonas sp.]